MDLMVATVGKAVILNKIPKILPLLEDHNN
jgi:hypothetical protein